MMRRLETPKVREGDRVFIYSPAEKLTKAHKFARPFKGPYRVKKVVNNDVELLKMINLIHPH